MTPRVPRITTRLCPQACRSAKFPAFLSALMFIDLEKDKASLFLNPKATHPLNQYHVEQLFDLTKLRGLLIDDFAHDDY